MRTAISSLGSVVCLTLLVAPARARKIEEWGYERLFKEADLVVIARADGSVDTKDEFKEKGWKGEFIGQETTLSVFSVLKGDIKNAKTIKVLHFRLPKDVAVKNGPSLVTFRNKALPLSGTINGIAFKAALGRPEYMLFLRARPDGRFEPTSGQIDPALSVREVNPPENFLSDMAEK